MGGLGNLGPTNQTPGDIDGIDTAVTAIQAVTDAIPDAGAMTSIAQEATLEDAETHAELAEEHVHNVARD